MNRFEFTDVSGDKLTVLPAKGGILIEAENAPHVPLDQVEAVVAGIRDMARQTGGQPVPQPVRIQLDGADAKAFADALRHGLRGSGPEGAGA
ncbi:hypothetical protein ACFWNQ_24945 [Streptomyces virginiae]|uniref:hypothetical protein n=1 Tax=Streptomyces virginiae TaxID=1961 RepID=UPI00364DF2A5